MSDLLNDTDAEESATGGIFDVSRFIGELRTYYLLLIALIPFSIALALIFIVFSQPSYTATAIVGPADNSDQPFGESAGLGALATAGRRLHLGGKVGAGGGDQDTFDEYTALLSSNRLTAVLVQKDRILPVIFSDQWDAAARRWLPRTGIADNTIDFVKRLLHRPVKTVPDQDDLEKFLEKNLTVATSLDTQFDTVTLKYADRDEAERVLNLILLEADNIIRQDKRRDVSARIAFLNNALEHVELADQKPQLIGILSDQEQEMMMIESDHRYASILIDPAHAPVRPTSPSPTIDCIAAVILACGAWFAAVRFTPQGGRLRDLVDWFARPKRRNTGPEREIAVKARRTAAG